MSLRKKVAIIGGGISGLTAAYHLRRTEPTTEIDLFEATNRLGGVLQTEHSSSYLIEQSADMFVVDPPDAIELCRDLGKSDELIETQSVSQRAFVATASGFEPVPDGFSLMLPTRLETIQQTKLLDDAGRERMLDEVNISPRLETDDESLQSFAVRRFGHQAFDRLIQPLVSGIYTADPQKLSMRATLNRFLEMEKEHGSLTAAARQMNKRTNLSEDQVASGARYGLFRAPKNGMGAWVDWLCEAVNDVRVHLNSSIESVVQTDSGWSVNGDDYAGVLFACSARTVSQVLQNHDELKELLDIEAASTAIVVLGIDQSQLQIPFEGFGIVIPSSLGRRVIAVSFSSNKFEGRAPDGKMLVRCFVGGALQGELVARPDGELVEMAINELSQLLGFRGEPELTRVFRWQECMPQYHLGHLERVKQIEMRIAQISGLELAGNCYQGVGIPVCIGSGIKSAERLVTQI